MASNDEAAAAFKAAALACNVHGDELGELAAYLSSMPENERKYMPVDDYTATIRFVRTKGRECRLVAAVVPRRDSSETLLLRGRTLRPTSWIYVILWSYESCMNAQVPSSFLRATVTNVFSSWQRLVHVLHCMVGRAHQPQRATLELVVVAQALAVAVSQFGNAQWIDGTLAPCATRSVHQSSIDELAPCHKYVSCS